MPSPVRESDLIPPEPLPKVELNGARLHAITESECVGVILNALDRGEGGTVVTMNLDHLRRFGQGGEYARVCAGASLVVADGMPLVWASRLQNTPLPERVTGADLIWSIASAAERQCRSIYLLGGSPGSAETTAEVLRQRYGGLGVVGISCPPFGFEQDEEQMRSLTADLHATQPDIVFVALGSPKQELLMDKLRGEFPSTWWLGVGITFSFVSNEIPRAPVWMGKMGLEWLYRWYREPGRLTKRYLVYGLPFAVKLMSLALVRRYSRSI